MSWDNVALSDVYWFQEGPGIRNWQFTSSGIKLLNVGNIEKIGHINLAKTDKHISLDEAHGKYKHFLCDEGDLVIASSGISFDEDGYLRTRGAFIEKIHMPLCINTSTIRFKSINGNDLGYLKHWLQSVEFRRQITKLVTGSAQLNFGPSHLKQLKISIPTLDEQKRIAVILDKAAAIKAKREQAIVKLDELASTMFEEAVSRSQKIEALGELCDVRDGTHDSPKYVTEGFPLITSKNIVDGKIDESTANLINEEDYKEICKRSKVDCGDILMPMIGTIGNPVIVEEVDPKFAIKNVALIKFKSYSPKNTYINSFLKSRYFYQYVSKLSRGGTQKFLGLGDIRKLPIPLLTNEDEAKFCEQLQRVKTLRELTVGKLAKVNCFVASLQHQAFTTGFN